MSGAHDQPKSTAVEIPSDAGAGGYAALSSPSGRPSWTLWLPALLVVPSVIWLVVDHHIWPWDQAGYAAVSEKLWYLLRHHTSQWPAAFFDAIWNSRPPLIAWLGEFFVPLGQMLGRIEIGLALLMIMAQYATLVLACKIGEAVASRRVSTAVCACLLIAAAPLSVWLTTQYWVEPLQLLAATYTFWIAVKCRSLRPLQTVGHLLLAFSIITSSKASSPLYCLVPGLLATAVAVRSLWLSGKKGAVSFTRSDLLLLVGAAAAAATSVAWYGHNINGVYEVTRDASFGAPALNYGTVSPSSVKFAHWIHLARVGFFLPLADKALLAAIVLDGLIRLSRHRGRFASFRWSYSGVLAAAALAQLMLVLITLSLNIGEDPRYILATVPSLAVLLAVYLGWGHKRVLPIACASILCSQALLVQASALGVLKLPVKDVLILSTPQDEQKTEKELLQLVDLLAQYNSTKSTLVGVSYPWLNVNTMNFLAWREQVCGRKGCTFIGLPILKVSELTKAVKALESPDVQFFISVEPAKQKQPADFANEVSITLWQAVTENKEFQRIPFPNSKGIAVFSKTR